MTYSDSTLNLTGQQWKQPQTQEVNAMNHRYRSYRKAPTFPLLEIGIGLTLSVVLLGIALTS